MTASVQVAGSIPDYETYDYTATWRGRSIEDSAERHLVLAWTKGTKGGETCLELGGGFGRITRILEPRFRKVFMLDYSMRNLRSASLRLKRTTLVRSTFAGLPFDDNTFDWVFLIRVMHHVTDPDSLLSEVARVGRNGGTFVLGIANEKLTGDRHTTSHALKRVTPEGHRIYSTPLGRYSSAALEMQEVRGVGAFDNRVGRALERFSEPLASLDFHTSRIWPIKPMLFIRFRVTKEEKEGRVDPRVRCGACPSGRIVRAKCDTCGKSYGRPVIDLVKDDAAGA